MGIFNLFRLRAEEKLGTKWQVRIGDFDHDSSLDDVDVLVLDITDTQVHPSYDGIAAYFDIAIIKTTLVPLSQVTIAL